MGCGRLAGSSSPAPRPSLAAGAAAVGSSSSPRNVPVSGGCTGAEPLTNQCTAGLFPAQGPFEYGCLQHLKQKCPRSPRRGVTKPGPRGAVQRPRGFRGLRSHPPRGRPSRLALRLHDRQRSPSGLQARPQQIGGTRCFCTQGSVSRTSMARDTSNVRCPTMRTQDLPRAATGELRRGGGCPCPWPRMGGSGGVLWGERVP